MVFGGLLPLVTFSWYLMDRVTFFQRLSLLVQKSRKAQRLYSNMGRVSSETSPYSESQIEEWRSITANILRHLLAIVDRPNSKTLVQDVSVVCENFHQTWRSSEAELHKAQRELISASERGDFVRAVSLAEQALVLKARVQATHAAYHELSDLLRYSKVASHLAEPHPIELTDAHVVPREINIFSKARAEKAQRLESARIRDVDGLDSVIEQVDREASLGRAKVIPLRR